MADPELDQRAAIVAGLKAGHSQVRVAADVPAPLYQVRKVAAEEGLAPKPLWRWISDDRKQAIVRLIKSGFNDAEIGRRLHASTMTVQRVRKEMAK